MTNLFAVSTGFVTFSVRGGVGAGADAEVDGEDVLCETKVVSAMCESATASCAATYKKSVKPILVGGMIAGN